jgi:hypothetical protein
MAVPSLRADNAAAGTALGEIVLSKIRVALTNMRPRLRDIVVDAIGRQPDMEIVGLDPGNTPSADVPAPDVIVAGAADPDAAESPLKLLAASPGTRRVLMIATGGQRAVMHQLRPVRPLAGEVSPQGLVDAIRSISKGPRGVE